MSDSVEDEIYKKYCEGILLNRKNSNLFYF